MGNRKTWISCEEANEIDLVNYLKKMGYEPTKIRNHDYWYLSPLRKENTASFKVNRKINCWYDHGIGEGGSVIDFGLKYHACTLPALLEMLSHGNSFVQQPIPKSSTISTLETKLLITDIKPLNSVALINYLEGRAIDLAIAKAHCQQVSYQLNEQHYYGIGFKNDLGGYEIRNPFYKYSSAPKAIRTFANGKNEVAVFEGFMDFLTYLSLHKSQHLEIDFMVLNGIGFFEKARPFLEAHQVCNLYLDRDLAGEKLTAHALTISNIYRDKSQLYHRYKDLNEYGMMQEAARRKRKSFRL